jgi:hypothetical protein
MPSKNNRNIFSVIMAAMMLPFFFINAASAACYFDGPSGRLSNFCAVNLINGKRVDENTIRLIDYKLKMEGHTNGLGFPFQVKKKSIQRSFNPLLYYSSNINGGNSSKPLKLGNLTFEGDEEFFRKAGIVSGISTGFGGRQIYGQKRYLQYNVNGSYAYSPLYKVGIATTGGRACDIRHLKNWWYLDSCAGQSRTRKDITDTTNSDLSFIASNFIRNSERSFSQLDLGLKRYFAENYKQNQVILGFDTIHSNGIFTDLNAIFGEAVESQLATRLSVSGRVITPLDDKPFSLYANYTESDGGIMLGINRDEKSYGISVSYPIWQRVSLSIGYQLTDSTIDYFDMANPTFGLQMSSIQF